MAKKKDVIPPIVNGLDDTYIVEKSRPLMLMKEVPFALGELKVLDTYLSRINARDPRARTVRFSKEEYEDLMEIERMRPERLGKYVDSIMQKIVTVPDPHAKGGWRKYTLFSTSECSQDDEGQWWVDLTCTQEAKKLFFNLQEIGYIRYQLKNILPLTSKHSVLLYVYLLDNRFRRTWEISIDNLRKTVFRNTSEYYNEYKYFKREIFDKALNEVNKKTDLTFSYEPVRKGRKVTGVKFTLVKDDVDLPELETREEDPNQIIIDYDDVDGVASGSKYSSDDVEFYAAACDKEFSEEEMQVLIAIVRERVVSDFHEKPFDQKLKRYHFLQKCYLELNARDAANPVKSRYAYLKGIVKNAKVD